jgi:protein NRD1
MDDLEALLQSLPALKPPGATKPKIDAITSLCITNIKVRFVRLVPPHSPH